MDRYLIKNGTLLSILDGSEQKADVLVEGGVITRIGENLDCAGAEVYDAAGMFVTVGWLEAHCHFLRPGSAVSLNPPTICCGRASPMPWTWARSARTTTSPALRRSAP